MATAKQIIDDSASATQTADSFTVNASEKEYKYTVATNYADFWANRSKWFGNEPPQQAAPSSPILPAVSMQGKIVSAQSKVGGGQSFLLQDTSDQSVQAAPPSVGFTSNLRGASAYTPPAMKLTGETESGMSIEDMATGSRDVAVKSGSQTKITYGSQVDIWGKQIEDAVSAVLNPDTPEQFQSPLSMQRYYPKPVREFVAGTVGGTASAIFKETQKPYYTAANIDEKATYAPTGKAELQAARGETFFTGITFAAFDIAGRFFKVPAKTDVRAGTAAAYDTFTPANVYGKFVPAKTGGTGEFVVGKDMSRGYTINQGYTSVQIPKVGEIARVPSSSRIMSISKPLPTPKGFISASQAKYKGEVRMYDVGGKVEFGTEPKTYQRVKVKGESLTVMKKGSVEVVGEGAAVQYPTFTEGKPSFYEYRYTQPAEMSIRIKSGVKGDIVGIEGGKKNTFTILDTPKIEGTVFKGSGMELTVASKPTAIKGTRLYANIGGKTDITVFSKHEMPRPEYLPLETPPVGKQTPFAIDIPKFPKLFNAPEVPLAQRPKPLANLRGENSIFGLRGDKIDFTFLKKSEQLPRAKAPSSVSYDVGRYDKPMGGGQVSTGGGQFQIEVPKPPKKIYSGGNFVPPDITPQLFRLPTGISTGGIPSILPKMFSSAFSALGSKGMTAPKERTIPKIDTLTRIKETPTAKDIFQSFQTTKTGIRQITFEKFTYKGFTTGGGGTGDGGGGGGSVDIDIKIPKMPPVLIGGFPFGGGGGGEGGAKAKGVKGNLRDILTVSRDVERNFAKKFKGFKL